MLMTACISIKVDRMFAKDYKANIPQPTVQMLTNGQDVSYLGMNISRKGNIITLSQPCYIKSILEKYTPTKKYVTPCTEDLFNRPASEMASPYINITQYLSLLMKLMFVATRTRPDTLTAVCGLATKCKALLMLIKRVEIVWSDILPKL